MKRKYTKHKENIGCFKEGHIPWNKNKKLNKPAHNKLPRKTVYCKCCNKPFEVSVNSQLKYYKNHYQKMLKLGNNPTKKPEIKEKIRKTLIETYKNHPEILENRKPCGVNQYTSGYTSIEKKVADVLEYLGIPFIHNCKIGRYFADFLILENVVIECDGTYWHKDKNKDKKRDGYLHDREYYVFRLSEKRIEKNALESIKSFLSILKNLEDEYTSRYTTKVLPFSK